MSKRLVAKLTVAVAALSAITLLQGCSNEVDKAVVSAAWVPFGSQPALGSSIVPGMGDVAGSSQTVVTGTTAAGGGGGGSQASSGATTP